MIKNFLIKFFIIILFFPNISSSNDLGLGKEVAKTICAACHGVDGRAASGGNSALVPNIFAQNKTLVDGVFAVVGDDVIFYSDIDEQILQYQNQGLNLKDESLRNQVIEDLFYQ